MNTPVTQEQLAAELAHFTGTESYTNLPYPWLRGKKFLLTDGAKYLAEQAQAFWLMDAIASHQISKQVAAEEFQCWTLTVNEKHVPAHFGGTDGDEKQLARQEIPYTTFPLESISLYITQNEYLGGLVVLLPSEY